MTVSGCSSSVPKQYSTSPWQDFGYEGIASKINRLAGPESINCGIRNLIEPADPVNKLLTPEKSKACIKAALQAGTPFRYGSIRIPIDSYLFDALLLDSNGETWTIKYDSMIDGSGNFHFIKLCKSVKVNYSNLSYEGIDCKELIAEQWLLDIPQQNGE